MSTSTGPARHAARGGALRGVTVAVVVRYGVLALVALAGLYIAFRHIGQQTTYTDETTYLGAGWQYVHGTVSSNLEHPPTAKYLFGWAELLLGPGLLAPRLVATTASFLTGVVLFAWLRRPLGHWGAVTAAALWWLTPRGDSPTWGSVASGSVARVDRLALLDPVMTCFAVLAVAAAWWWAQRPAVLVAGGRLRAGDRPGVWTGWWWMALAGAALAASVTSKVSSAVLVLAVAVVPVLFRRWTGLLVGGVVAAAAFAVVFIAAYLPVGGAGAIRYMLDFQEAHNSGGHLTSILGKPYAFSPWWANFVFAEQGTGWLLTVVLLLGVLCAVVLRPDRLVALLAVALGALVVFYASAHVALPHYYTAWMPFVVALAAVGYTRLWRLRPPATAVLAVVLVAATVVPATQLAVAVEQARPSGLARLGGELRAHGVADSAPVLFAGSARQSFAVYFPVGRGYMQGPSPKRYRAIVEGTDERFPLRQTVRAYLDAHPERFEAFRVDQFRVWVPRDGASFVLGSERAVLTR